jgi:hypothetical protein
MVTARIVQVNRRGILRRQRTKQKDCLALGDLFFYSIFQGLVAQSCSA